MSHTLKISLKNEIRLLPMTQPYPDWSLFLAQCSSLFSHQFSGENVRIYYNDDENDRVLIESQAEWQIALSILTSQKIGKMYIEARNTTNNKDNDNNSPSFNDINMKEEDQRIPFRFSRHPFGHGFSHPPSHPHGRHHGWHHMRPTRGHCGNLYPNNGGFFGDINVNNNNNNIKKESTQEWRGSQGCPWRGRGRPEGFNLECHKKEFKKFHRSFKRADKSKKLERKMHKRAFLELEEKNYSVASKLYEALISLNPKDPVSFYNMACCHALSGATELALTNLALAVETGYSDPHHIENDQDLVSIREHPQYRVIVGGMMGTEV
eukprot:TRINITY_DN2074_c0_g1_i1.p1 TRINITY_DN2074_c0_g1~~TRINITY_DN2074_c0_g1_i1.p1  ORF type:complete len:322 (-),score=56.93 TRINITY_DN2074_c0_g1_i1:128-1093(-)